MPLFPDDSNPTGNWNPIESFWRIFYPVFQPRPGASAVKISPPSPIWDLPSPYGNVMHPGNKDEIPPYVEPDYYAKLYTEPAHTVVHDDPPLWMLVRNFDWQDSLFRIPLMAATGPAFVYFMAKFRGRSMPGFYPWFATSLIGTSLGFGMSLQDSQNRLQGYLPNKSDVEYWTKRAEYERRVASGEIDERLTGSLTSQAVKQMFGPSRFDLKELEGDYYAKEEKKPQ